MTKWRRFEVMLPLLFNDGRRVPRAWIGEAMSEVGDHFGNASYETQTIMGIWRQGSVTYRDQLMRLFVDVHDNSVNRAWMKGYKARWKKKLKQLEIWMVSYRIEIE